MNWTTNSNTKAIVAMLVATIALSSMAVFVKIIGPNYHPVQITFLRAVIALVVLAPFYSEIWNSKGGSYPEAHTSYF